MGVYLNQGAVPDKQPSSPLTHCFNCFNCFNCVYGFGLLNRHSHSFTGGSFLVYWCFFAAINPHLSSIDVESRQRVLARISRSVFHRQRLARSYDSAFYQHHAFFFNGISESIV